MSDLEESPVMDHQEGAIDYFGGVDSPLVRFKSRVSLRARRRMFDRFMQEFAPRRDTTVIDVGVTPDEKLVDSNAFEQFYPYKDRITATSFEDATSLEKAYPGLRFVQTSGKDLPFPDGAFDLAFSSAVLEHVGDRDAQREFIREVMRVADGFYIAVPEPLVPPRAAHLPAGDPLAAQEAPPGDPAPARQGLLGPGGEPQPGRRR